MLLSETDLLLSSVPDEPPSSPVAVCPMSPPPSSPVRAPDLADIERRRKKRKKRTAADKENVYWHLPTLSSPNFNPKRLTERQQLAVMKRSSELQQGQRADAASLLRLCSPFVLDRMDDIYTPWTKVVERPEDASSFPLPKPKLSKRVPSLAVGAASITPAPIAPSLAVPNPAATSMAKTSHRKPSPLAHLAEPDEPTPMELDVLPDSTPPPPTSDAAFDLLASVVVLEATPSAMQAQPAPLPMPMPAQFARPHVQVTERSPASYLSPLGLAAEKSRQLFIRMQYERLHSSCGLPPKYPCCRRTREQLRLKGESGQGQVTPCSHMSDSMLAVTTDLEAWVRFESEAAYLGVVQ